MDKFADKFSADATYDNTVIPMFLNLMTEFKDSEMTLTKVLESLGELCGFDPVTGLMNFMSFYSQSAKYLIQNPDSDYAVCSFELSSLNEVSEWHGPITGNKLVKYFADSLKAVLPNAHYMTRDGHSIFHVFASVNNQNQFLHFGFLLLSGRFTYMTNE